MSENGTLLPLQPTARTAPWSTSAAVRVEGETIELAPNDIDRLTVMAAAVRNRLVAWDRPVPKKIAIQLLLNYLIRLHALDEDVINAVAAIHTANSAGLSKEIIENLEGVSTTLNAADQKREQLAREHGLVEI